MKSMAPFCFWGVLVLFMAIFVGLEKLPHEQRDSGHFIAERARQEFRAAPPAGASARAGRLPASAR